MLILSFLVAALAPATEAVDAANLELTTCGYQAFREAHGADRDMAGFKVLLEERCSAAVRSARASFIPFLMAMRGIGRAEAERITESMLADRRAHFIGQYERRHEADRQLKALERALQMEGKQ